MMDDEVVSAQTCLDISKSRSAMGGILEKQNMEMAVQMEFDGSKELQMLSR